VTIAVKSAQREQINSHLRRGLAYLDMAHRMIGTDTHPNSYHRTINDIEDAMAKVREAARAN
jgi:hypothetical protein